MVSAWFMDDSDADQRLEHQKSPPEPVGIEQVQKLTGVLYWKLNPATFDSDGIFDQIKKERGYTYEDVIAISEDKLPNYEEKLKIFYSEHLHTDEEIRYCAEGSGYFDVRDLQEKWIRIHLVPGDLIVLPAGIYHRFTLDAKNYIKARRFFVGEPIWTAHNRPSDDMEARREYLATYCA